MMVLGLDFGKHTGFAVINEKGELVHKELLSMSSHKGERAYKLFHKINSWCMFNQGAIAYERLDFIKGKSWQQMYYGFLAIAELLACEYNIPCYGVPVGTLKKHATGIGNCAKELMIQSANKKYDLSLLKKDHDIADAIWVADWCWNKVNKDVV